jgi:hypothetical protein
MSSSSNWTPESESLLKKWGTRAQFYQILYEQGERFYRQRDRWFGIPILVLGTITTSTIFIQLDGCNKIQHLVSGVLSFLFTLLSALGKFANYRELTFRCREAAQGYDRVSMDIQEQLTLPPADRVYVYQFTAGIKSRLHELKQAPVLPEKMLHQYLANIDNHFNTFGIPLYNPKFSTTADKADVEPTLTDTTVATDAAYLSGERDVIMSDSANLNEIMQIISDRSSSFAMHQQ